MGGKKVGRSPIYKVIESVHLSLCIYQHPRYCRYLYQQFSGQQEPAFYLFRSVSMQIISSCCRVSLFLVVSMLIVDYNKEKNKKQITIHKPLHIVLPLYACIPPGCIPLTCIRLEMVCAHQL